MNSKCCVLGINVGTVSASVVLLDEEGAVVCGHYDLHEGNIGRSLNRLLSKVPTRTVAAIGINDKGREYVTNAAIYDDVLAVIAGGSVAGKPGAILAIGGENFGLIVFDKAGGYKKFISNTSCAAGTGLFLDQQALRLGLNGSRGLAEQVGDFDGVAPKIATRCGVFAKTDLIHAQQQGFGLSAICDGLLRGVAQTIVNTVFANFVPEGSILAVGGVAKNDRIIRYISQLINRPILTMASPELVSAHGIALLAQRSRVDATEISIDNLVRSGVVAKQLIQAPLAETKRVEVDFSSLESFVSPSGVEVDIYEPLAGRGPVECLIGIDVGSTSTKAAITDDRGTVLAGLYTRTMGQPIRAVQLLMETIAQIEKSKCIEFVVMAAGTTGSGRRFVGNVIGADFAINEISAHAKAAAFLNPSLDTIIEIGGQDAKFTVLRKGEVVFSVMNYACAAGTGSFIEEQAMRLGTSLADFCELSLHAWSPRISDRCSVFMERDLNSLLSQGYSKDELMAAAIRSVCDNYFSKVARQGKIGRCVAFQGATAKNKALVRAFEQKLGQPIHVSKFCHLTGALGVCLLLQQRQQSKLDRLDSTRFRKQLHEEQIVLEKEICEVCQNKCKISVVRIGDTVSKWGYMCGRDEDSKRVEIAEVLKKRQAAFIELEQIVSAKLSSLSGPMRTIGIPASLPLIEYVPFWKAFFAMLGLKPVMSSNRRSFFTEGKKITGTEFCAPLVNYLGHLAHLAARTDYLFCPHLFETVEEGGIVSTLRKFSVIDYIFRLFWKKNIRLFEKRKHYCYYTNYAVPVFKSGANTGRAVVVSPTFVPGDHGRNVKELYKNLPLEIKSRITRVELGRIYNDCWREYRKAESQIGGMLQNHQKKKSSNNNLSVVLLGRPYLLLDSAMNKGVPELLERKGVDVFTMDMVDTNVDRQRFKAAATYLEHNQWHFGERVLKAAERIAATEDVFPIFVTAFKCSPDSFLIQYFEEIMDAYGKPYLILQLDDHGSVEGYETRLEAALDTFRNYVAARRATLKCEGPKAGRKILIHGRLAKKTYLIPAYDPISSRFACKAFKKTGYGAVMLNESLRTIEDGISLNDGQCLPVSLIAHECIDTVRKHGLNPCETVLFLNSRLSISCNFPQYPIMIKRLFEKAGGGMEQVDIFSGAFAMSDLPMDTVHELYAGYIFSSLIQKMVCRMRPRELQTGVTDLTAREAEKDLIACIRNGDSKEEALSKVVSCFKRLPVSEARLPQVGIVGDLYAKYNDVFNQDLIREIEAAGGEAVITPFFDLFNLFVRKHASHDPEADYLLMVKHRLPKQRYAELKSLLAMSREAIGERLPTVDGDSYEYLSRNNLTYKHKGETAENILQVYYLKQNFPDLRLIVNVNPIFCCPALTSEATFEALEAEVGISIVSITYDGTRTRHNRVIKPYLKL